MIRQQTIVWSGFLLLLAGLPGCATETPEHLTGIVPVTGKVTLQGEPLANATVIFEPQGTGAEAASGTTGTDGTYSLKTIVPGQGPQDGAVPGRYRVVITKIVLPDGSAVPPDMTDADAEDAGAKQIVPAVYSDSSRTTLVGEVPEGGGTVDFELTQ